MYYIFLCIYVCVCVCVFVCLFVCLFMWVGARARACACAHVALIIQHATRRHTVICSLSLSPLKFSTLSHTRHDIRKKKKNFI
jgi:hypothetical protein